MIGIIDVPERPLQRGVLIVASHPHSRLGENRQYAMLARALARRGITAMRFDRRGVGDSEGCHHNDYDVLAALRELNNQVPALRDVVLLAPPSSAALNEALACAAVEEQISGLILLETWHANQQGGRRGAQHAPAMLRALTAPRAGAAPATPLVAAQAPALYAVPCGPAASPKSARTAAAKQQPATAVAVVADLDALGWRRSRAPRRRTTADQRLNALAAQLCAFPGPVLLVAAPPGNTNRAVVAGRDNAASQDSDADMQATLSRLAASVTRDCPDRRIEVVCAAALAEGNGLRDSDGPGRGGLTDICASWLVSW